MCNRLHSNFKPIPEEGIGYKIFFQDNLSCFRGHIEYRNRDKEGYIRWVENSWHEDEGFCFFLTLKGALNALGLLYYPQGKSVKKISYKKGMGKHQEKGMVVNHRLTIALCKQFKILEY